MSAREIDLASRLGKLCIFLNNTFEINAGGCCFIASVIAHCLEQDDLNYKVGVCNNEDYEFESFYDIGCEAQYHYFIVLDKMNINDDGEEHFQVFDNVSSKDLLDHYLECNDWNPTYNNLNNDFIEHLIKELYVKFYEAIFERESNCICL